MEEEMRLVIRTISTLLLLAILMTLAPGGSSTAGAASCYWAQFVADVTIPDGTNFAANTAFKKTWRIKNIGSCAWGGDVSLIFDSGERMNAPASLTLPTTVNPGQTVDITVDMTSPANAGHYFGYWKFKTTNFGGLTFGIGSNQNKSFWVEIRVSGGSTGAGYDFTVNAPSAQWSSGAGAFTFPAPDGSANGFAFKVDQPKLESGVTSAQAGLLMAPNNVTNGFVKATYPAFRVQNGDRFQATIGCEYGATNCYVAYSLYYKVGNGPETTFWTFREKYEGWTYNVNLDLSRLAGQDVTFVLVTSAYGSPTGDRALWVNPIIARVGGGNITPPPPPPPTGNKYDFGTGSSPLASGYNRVTETTNISGGNFGWTDTSGLESRDRTTLADDLNRDFVMHVSAPRTFKVNLTNGTYTVNVTMGDKDFAHDNMIVKANGTTVLGDVDSAAGAFTSNTFNVSVTGGSLSLEFSDGGGSDPTWVVNSLVVTPTSTVTPIPNACDRAQFIADVTVRDGTAFAPGIGFSKTWRLKNVGTCTWTNYSIMFDSGEKMGGPDSALIPASVAPGQTVDITLALTSPTTAGTYRGYWKLKNNTGVPFGIGSAGTKSFWVEIKVTGTGIVPNTPTKTTTPGTPSTPATAMPGTIYDFAANVCAAKWYSGAGELPCPGADGDARGFVLIANPSRMENGVTDARTGLITYPQNINNGYIQGIYPSYLVKSGDKFRATIGCESGATSCYVVFRLDYSISGTSSVITYWAFVERYEGQVYNAEIDLSSLAGQNVKFILTVLSTGSAVGDRALWVSPIIYNASSGSQPATATSTGTATPTATSTTGPTFTATNTTTAPSATATQTATGTPTPTNTP
ncbi:MAG: hypothetical protein DYG86_03985 [Chloroflexi bacterium CFX2]|nr:hypothetical protein [Chloroflexi bacterium CFX2]